jgi:hypothetical protein
MKTLTALGTRTAAIGAIALFLAACANSSVPGNPSEASMTSKVKPATACGTGGSGIAVGSGDNGTFSVAIGNTCDMAGPDDTECVSGELSGYTYTFQLASTGSLGVFNTSGNTASFKRTASGNVKIDLMQSYHNAARNCEGSTVVYGYVTLD